MTVSEVVDAVAQAFHDGVASRDTAALASLYAENARFLAPGMEPCEGRAQVQTAMQVLLDMGARSLDLEPLEVREADDLTIEYGRYRLGIEPEGSEPVTDFGKYLVVHQRQADGSTKILYDMFNSNTPGG
jgi:ketosteroid isomerase-like protein